MNLKGFVLRLAVGLLCFAVGWASAALLAASRATPSHVALPPHMRPDDSPLPPLDPPPLLAPPAGCVLTVRVTEGHDAERVGESESEHFGFEVPPPPRPRHAHEWHDVPSLEEFDVRFAVPPPPPLPRPRRHHR